MFKNKKKSDPLVVIVTENEWTAHGDPANFHHQFLYRVLDGMGGINESVSPGKYHFDAKRVGFRFIANLEPAED